MVSLVAEFAIENFLFMRHTYNFVMYWNEYEKNVVN